MDETNTTTPLARVYRLDEMPGAIGKWLAVPPARIGIVVDDRGRSRSLLPGRRLALSAFQRIRGGGIGLRAGYVPDGLAPFWLPSGALLSGDGELMDASLWGQLRVVDPVRFLVQDVTPVGVVEGPVMDLSRLPLGQPIGLALAGLVAEYAAADLVAGLPTDHLLSETRRCLEPVLAASGLSLALLEALSFRRASDRVEIAQKLLALDERLGDIELQRKMAAIEQQVELEDFIRQLDPELVEKAGLRVAAVSSAPVTPVVEGPHLAAVPAPVAPAPRAPQPRQSAEQARLEGVDPQDRLPSSRSEEDLLDIPAFLRRQAN